MASEISVQSKIIQLFSSNKTIFTEKFFESRIDGRLVHLPSAHITFHLSHQRLTEIITHETVSLYDAIYILFFLSHLRTYFHFCTDEYKQINLELVRIENFILNDIITRHDSIKSKNIKKLVDLDEIISISSALSTNAADSNCPHRTCNNKLNLSNHLNESNYLIMNWNCYIIQQFIFTLIDKGIYFSNGTVISAESALDDDFKPEYLYLNRCKTLSLDRYRNPNV